MLTNSWDRGHDLTQLQFVQQGGFTCSIQTHCRNTNRHTHVTVENTTHIQLSSMSLGAKDADMLLK